jgi:hypothetical protein
MKTHATAAIAALFLVSSLGCGAAPEEVPESAGTFSATLDGEPFEAAHVWLIEDPSTSEGTSSIQINVEEKLDRNNGDNMLLSLMRLPPGTGAYPIVENGAFGLSTGLGRKGSAKTGTVDITRFDDERLEGTFEASMAVISTLGPTWEVTSGAFSVDRAQKNLMDKYYRSPGL